MIKTLQGIKVTVGRCNGGWNTAVGVGMEKKHTGSENWSVLLDVGAGSMGEEGGSWVSGLDKWLILKPFT